MAKRLQFPLVTFGLCLCLGNLLGCGTEESSSGMVGDATVVINEAMAKNDTTPVGTTAAMSDWVELYNLSDADVSLEGYFMSDDGDDVFQSRLPAEAIVPAKGFLVLLADGETAGLHLRFKLSSDGDKVILNDPDGVEIDRVEFGLATADQSEARFPDGTGEFSTCASSTPGASNGQACAVSAP